MSGFLVKLRKFKYNLRHEYFTTPNVILMLAVILCLSWTYRSIEAMSRNWELSEKLNSAHKNLELKKVEIETAELENEYYKTEEYQELAARRSAGKQLDGEKMVYLPANSEAAKNKHVKEEPVKEEKKEYSNFEQWMMYLWP